MGNSASTQRTCSPKSRSVFYILPFNEEPHYCQVYEPEKSDYEELLPRELIASHDYEVLPPPLPPPRSSAQPKTQSKENQPSQRAQPGNRDFMLTSRPTLSKQQPSEVAETIYHINEGK